MERINDDAQFFTVLQRKNKKVPSTHENVKTKEIEVAVSFLTKRGKEAEVLFYEN